MDSSDSPARVRVAEAACGTRTYLVDLAPEALPPVRARDLHAAWDSARGAALAQAWGRPLMLRFRRAEGEASEMALADADACCWAAAVDATVGLASPYGMSLCLRLLALVELLPRAPWALPLVALRGEGASIHPALMAAAARVRLSPAARFDSEGMRAAVLPALGLAAPAAMPPALSRLSAGARA
jgi:hypothetical protein